MTPPSAFAPASSEIGPTADEAAVRSETLAVVLCGSFRRGLKSLRADVKAFQTEGCRVLSPVTLDFVSESEGFVYLEHELTSTPVEIEEKHLACLRSADLVWLHAPNGYVGSSGAFELGVAHMAGVSVFCREVPADATLRNFVDVAESPAAAVASVRRGLPERAGASLAALQAYYARVAERRGWNSEGPTDCMLLLTEEIGELARAIRRSVGIARDGRLGNEDAGEELADVQLYLVHLANTIGVDLASAVTDKERLNARRALLRAAAA